MEFFWGGLVEQGEVKVKKKKKKKIRGQYIKSTSRLNQTHQWNSEKKNKLVKLYLQKLGVVHVGSR